MMIFQELAALIAAVAVLVCAVGWFFRLEGRVNYQERFIAEVDKEVDHLRIKLEALDYKVFEKLSSVEKALARIEGALGVKQGEKDA
jgi:hypothetical protein